MILDERSRRIVQLDPSGTEVWRSFDGRSAAEVPVELKPLVAAGLILVPSEAV